MSTHDYSEWSAETAAIRAFQHRSHEQEHVDPLYMTSSFVYGSAAEAMRKFSGEEEGNVYARFHNPTVQLFEKRLAIMEGGEQCVATSSGMSAILSLALGLLKSGDEILASSALFGSTVGLFLNYLKKFGITIRFIPAADVINPEVWADSITSRTRLLFAETPSNPLATLIDIQAIAEVAHRHDALLVIDNCFCTPILQQPLALGADIVVHSATKYIDGQGRAVGGAVVGRREHMQEIFNVVRTCGPCLSPFNAWLFIKGLETLSLRMKVHCEQAAELAKWLEAHPAVANVYYCGLPSHPQYELAKRQLNAFGAVIGFEVHGGREAAWSVIDSTQMLSITGNLGDVRTTITHPATTTHGKLTYEQRTAAGIEEGLIRISVGLEGLEDIKQDLARGLDALVTG